MSADAGSHESFHEGRAPLAPAPGRPRAAVAVAVRDHARFLAAEVALLAAFGLLTVAVIAHPGPLPGDLGLTLWWQHLVLPVQWLANGLEALSSLTFPIPFTYILAGILLVLLLLRRRLDALLALGTVVFGLGTTLLINGLILRPRPSGSGVFVAADITKQFHVYSFPSGHVVTAAVFFGILLFMAFQVRRPVPPWLAASLWIARVALLAAIILMVPSRVLEGEHWPSDGLAGLLWGGFWLLLTIQVYYWLARRRPRWLGPGEPRPRPGATQYT